MIGRERSGELGRERVSALVVGSSLPMPMRGVLSRGTELELCCKFSGCDFMPDEVPRGTELPLLRERSFLGRRLVRVELIVCFTSETYACFSSGYILFA